MRNVITKPVSKGAEMTDRMTMRYEPNACAMWHSDCPNHFGGIMKLVRNEEGKSLFECLHCGKRGHYPVGRSGDVCVDVVAAAPKEPTHD